MNERLIQLRKQYKPHIVPGKRDVEEMIAWIAERVDLKECPLNVFSQSFVKHLYYNLEHCVQYLETPIAKGQFCFLVYEVLKTTKNKKYYHLNAEMGHGDESIYLILETQLEVCFCNSNQLYLETMVAWGVDERDYNEDTLLLDNYIFMKKSLEDGLSGGPSCF